MKLVAVHIDVTLYVLVMSWPALVVPLVGHSFLILEISGEEIILDTIVHANMNLIEYICYQ